MTSDDLGPVSIGIPMYNCGPYLIKAIQSIFAQTHEEWELLLVDDGSTDGSLELACSIDDSRVRVIADGSNKGLAARLNEIAERARYPVVARMDGDDLIHPERIERQLTILSQRPDLDLIGTGTYSMTSDGTLIGLRGADRGAPSLEDVLSCNYGLVHASLVYRRDWILRHRYDPTVRRSEDFDLFARAAASGDLSSAAIAEPLYVYREDLNITRNKLLGAYHLERLCIAQHSRSVGAKSRLLAKNCTKSVMVAAFFGPMMQRYLQKRRNPVAPTAAQRARFDSIMKLVSTTKVPGMETP